MSDDTARNPRANEGFWRERLGNNVSLSLHGTPAELRARLALRRLVEQASRDGEASDRARRAREPRWKSSVDQRKIPSVLAQHRRAVM